MKPICFISGAITDETDCDRLFTQAEQSVKSLGFIPYNPYAAAKPLLDNGGDFPHFAWMDICLSALKHCDAVYHLTNWRNSKGAAQEHYVALSLNLPIFYHDRLDMYLSVLNLSITLPQLMEQIQEQQCSDLWLV